MALLVKLSLFYAFRLYARYWSYASIYELIDIALAVWTSSALLAGLFFLGQGLGWVEEVGLPRSVPIIDGLLTLLFVGGSVMPVCMD